MNTKKLSINISFMNKAIIKINKTHVNNRGGFAGGTRAVGLTELLLK